MQAAEQDSRKTPYLLLLLLPLLLLALAGYSWFLQPLRSDFALRGLLPQRLAAQQSVELSLLRPAAAPDYQLVLENPRLQTRQPLPSFTEGTVWRAQIPALDAGVYGLHWQQADAAEPAFSLPVFVQERKGLLLSDQTHYSPGDTVVVHLSQLPEALPALQLRIRSSSSSRLERVALQAGSAHWRGRIPADAQGQISIEVLGIPNPPAPLRLSVQSTQAVPDDSLRLWPLTDLVAHSGQAQTLTVFALNPAGQPVENGWIQVLGKAFAIQAGRAEITLPEHFQAKKLTYAAGDSQGHLAQGSWPLRRSEAVWHAAFSVDTQQWQLSSPQATPLFWMLFQHRQVLAQGVLTAGAEPQTLPLPVLPSLPSTLLLQDSHGHSQLLHWLPDAISDAAELTPSNPHALQPLSVDLKAAGPYLDLVQYQVLGQRAQRTDSVAGGWHWLGDRVSTPSPWFLCFWMLAALLCSSWPWLWLWRVLQQRIRQHQRPFANSQRKQRIALVQKQVLAFGFAGCGLALLSSLPLPGILPLVAALLLSLGSGALISWQLRQLALGLHPVVPWLPLLQGQLWFWSCCFVWAHQPLSLPALFLSGAVFQLAWWLWFQRLAPVQKRSQQSALVLLASLTVLSPLLLVRTGLQPMIPVLREVLPLQSALIQPAESLQLLHYTSSPAPRLNLPPAYHAGLHRLQWRSLNAQGQALSFAETLTVQPAVLAQAHAPRFALRGDQLQIPLRLHNATAKPQRSSYRFAGQAAQPLNLGAGESQTRVINWTARETGWQTLGLQHLFAGQWFSRDLPLFVQVAEAARQDPALKLELVFPAGRDLLVDEEIPVRVRFSHSLPTQQGIALGLQIGIPAGFEVLTDTLDDPTYTRWLQGHEMTAGYLNLRTHLLPAETPYGAHFRLRATLAGRVQAPSSRLFVLNQPERLTRVLHPERFEVRRP